VLLAVSITAAMLVGSRSDSSSERQQFVSGPAIRSATRVAPRAWSIEGEPDMVGLSSPENPEHAADPPLADPISSELLHAVSGPELEGLLDLWESETRTVDQLSI
jgi:hypothetical protein